ncbi:MAG: helix-turn-helix transcriptional regulator [Pseudomonadota bacterium]
MSDMKNGARKGRSMINGHVGSRLRGRRVLLGLSQAQLGRALGVTFQQIQKYENGASQLTPERLQKAADALGVTVDFFFKGLEGGESGSDGSPDIFADAASKDGQVLALVRSFTRIEDPAQRRGFLHLVRSIAKSELSGSPPPAC